MARFAPQLAAAAAVLSVGAAAIHAAAAGPHFEEWAPFGVLFAIAALAQAVWGALVLARPSARLVAAGVAGNVAIIAAWALSRTAGLPVGPDAGTPEPVAVLDAVASVFELGGVVTAGALLAGSRFVRPFAVRTTGRFALAAAVVVVAITGTALAQDGAGHHHPAPAHEHEHATPHHH